MWHRLNLLSHWLFPPSCLQCGARIAEQDMWLCNECLADMHEVQEDCCPVCSNSTFGEACRHCAENGYVFTRNISLYTLEGPARLLIHRLKYTAYTRIGKWFGRQMHRKIADNADMQQVDIVTAIPLHKVRYRERGYNQSELIAVTLAMLMGKPFEAKLLVRVSNTHTQTGLSRIARQSNLQGRFRIGKLDVKGKVIMLVDDVFTTGSTVNEASKTLLNAGADRVYVMTACHGK